MRCMRAYARTTAASWVLICSGMIACGCSAKAGVHAQAQSATPPPAAAGTGASPAAASARPPVEAKVTVTKKSRVEVTRTEIKINEKILFAFKKADIEPASDELIKTIAEIMKAHAEIELIEVAGHADRVGGDRPNVELTQKRAGAVVDALVKYGVERERLRAVGYGRYCPLDAGDSAEAREKNRRVEFKIVRSKDSTAEAELGCADAAAHGIKPPK
jgi:outer membrane protein OmpA-like peptidoglycan-associated protein